MGNYKVPSQAASGSETFSDALVGNQITTGSNQMTGTNFAIEKSIPEKDSKQFITEPFSEFVTLDSITQESTTVSRNDTQSSERKIKFNNDKNNADRSLYGSLKQRLNVAIQDIILKYPAGVLVDGVSPVSSNSYTAEEASYSLIDNSTEFKVQKALLYNPLEVVFIEPKSSTPPSTDNDIRNFFSSYTKYLIVVNNITYDIVSYTEPDADNKITLKVTGNPFSGTTGSTENYLIRPNDGVVEQFYNGLNDLQTVLLNRVSFPIFNAGFNVPRETNGGYGTETVTEYVNWPVSKDGWNIQIEGVDYGFYVQKLSDLGDEIDAYKSNLIVRFLTAPQIFEFDTEEHKAEAIFQIYGQSFDEIKTFIDNIAYMRNVSYDGINNVPDVLLKNLSETLGLSTVNLFNEKTLQDSLYTRHDTKYAGVSTGTNLIEAEYEFYRRILSNLAFLYKSKGTRSAIEFFLKFIGAPEPMIRLDEFVYKVDELLPSKNVEGDIREAILGSKTFNIATPLTGSSGTVTGYTLTQISGSTTLDRDGYPVDETTGLPRKIVDSTGQMFFEKGAGWYSKTLEHRSPDIFDASNSDLTTRTKIIKTTSKPFTYGEDYFNIFRKLPGLDYGYNLSSVVDNKKAEVADSEFVSDLTLNRKNINILLSADQAIDYDIYRKSRDLETSFSILTPQTGVTFAEFLDSVLNDTIKDSNFVKYSRFYTGLTEVYTAYQSSTGFTPYNFVKIEEFINRLSPYWVNIIEQFVPATTLWLGGNSLRNGSFNRSKFQHQRPVWFDVVAPSPTPSVTPSLTPSPTITPSLTPTPSITPTPSRISLSATIQKVDPLCFGAHGTITVSNPVGGSGAPYEVKLDAGGTYESLSPSKTYINLDANSYTVYVRDSALTEVTYPVTINEPSQQVVTIFNITADGFSMTSTNGTWPKVYNIYNAISSTECSYTAPYLYQAFSGITQGSPTITLSGLPNGYYCTEVRDGSDAHCQVLGDMVQITGIVPTPSITPTITPTPSITATPAPTPSNIPYQAFVNVELKGDGGGTARLVVTGNDNTEYYNEITPGTHSTVTASFYIPQSNLPFTVTGSWQSGSGSESQYRICDIENGGENYTSSIINISNSSDSHLVSPTPWRVNIQVAVNTQTLDSCGGGGGGEV